MDKKELRSIFLKRRKEFALTTQKEAADKAITDTFIKTNFILEKSFFVYISYNNEPQTSKIIDFLLKNNKNVLVPKLKNNTMHAAYFTKDTKTALNKYGIAEPIDDNFYTDSIDVAVLPLLAATTSGVRLGYGGGYYDRFLQNKNTVKIGLCYDLSLADKLPQEKHDVLLDFILTEKRFINTH